MSEWLEVFAKTFSATEACKLAGVDRNTIYAVRESDPAFAQAWRAAREALIDGVEGALLRKALGGDVVAQIFFLKNNRPDTYSDRLELRHMGEVEHRLELVDGREPRELDSRRRREAARLLLEGSSDGALEALEVETTAGGDITSGVLDGPGPSE
jgi:hypothetical protein